MNIHRGSSSNLQLIKVEPYIRFQESIPSHRLWPRISPPTTQHSDSILPLFNTLSLPHSPRGSSTMRARLVVFPVKGRNWCFSRSVDSSSAAAEYASAHTPSGLRELWTKISSNSVPKHSNVELLIDFVSNKVSL